MIHILYTNMPRVGSREWNRQQNLRRQREEEQVVQAQIVFQQPQQVIVEAEPLECRRDIQNLREQIQNKIHQIEQLKKNTKEMKKVNKELMNKVKTMMNENKQLNERILSLVHNQQSTADFVVGIDKKGWVHWDDDDDGTFKKIPVFIYDSNTANKYLENENDIKPTKFLTEYREVTSYIKWLEDTLLSRQECVDYIKETNGWWGYYTADDNITDDRLLKYTNNSLCKKILETRIKLRKVEEKYEIKKVQFNSLKKKEEYITKLLKSGDRNIGGVNNNGKEYIFEGDEEMKQAFINGGFSEMDELIEKRKQKS